ncbi:glycosyltransferase family 39 protein [Algoriphagus taiwanensis]|uniref:Glycosyltransferase family 39 protein n=2 Tax=Algoriphagus taiwanensis TaxID=1445656 RepID=A0ABQ6Q1C7_9BACT|nr:glycosyltransferase family 39 protein [Algoriphagus taiwanensis]
MHQTLRKLRVLFFKQVMKNPSPQKYLLIFWSVNLALAVIKLFFAFRPELDLFTEEAQYWLWSRNLDWHYYSKPPMVAVLNFISTGILGHKEVAIRMIPILAGLGTAWIVFRFTDYLYSSKKTACLAGLLFLGMPIHLLEFTFHTTDTSMTFFWTWAWFMLYRAIQENKTSLWVAAGLITALGIMSKATMILIFPASLIFLFLSGKLKEAGKQWLILLGISLLGFLPSLIWNLQNDFYTFKHLAALGGASGGEPKPFDLGLLVSRTSEYLSGQLAMVSVFFLPFFFFAVKKTIRSRELSSFYVALPGLLTFLGFGGLSLFTWIEVNWPGFAYSTFPVFLAPVVANMESGWKKYTSWAVGVSLALQILLLSPNIFQWKSQGPIFKAEKAIFKRMVGYEDLGNRIDFLQDSLGLSSPVLFSESYHVASELAFYVDGHPQPYTINMGSRKNQWDLWPGMDQFIGQERTFIFVSRGQESPESVTNFGRLIYEEKYPHAFRSDTLGFTKIQIWEDLLDYTPVDTGKF